MYTKEFVDEKREFTEDNKKTRSRKNVSKKAKISSLIKKSDWIKQGKPKLESFE
jgi:hypothetical protein